MSSSYTPIPSPGNAYGPSHIPMRLPFLEHLYRLEAVMAEREITVGSPFGTKQSRIIMPIEGGSINGPTISGVIEHLSGADWVTAIEGTDFMKLDARYTIRTDDSHYLYIQAKGVFSNGPGRPGPLVGPAAPPLVNLTQDQVEWFTHINIEAGPGPYHWLNSILAVGVLAMHEKKIIIDAYLLTNFPGLPPRDVAAA